MIVVITFVIQIDANMGPWRPGVPLRPTRLFSSTQCLGRNLMMLSEFVSSECPFNFGTLLVHALGLMFGVDV